MATEKIKKPFYKKWWVWLLAIIIVIAIANSGEEESATEANKADTETAKSTDKAEAKETKKEETVVGIGEALKVGDVEFTVNGTSTAKNVGGQYGANAQGTYLLIDVTVKNVGTEAITVDSSFFKLMVGEKTYESDSTAGIYANENAGFFLDQVNPDLSITGKAVFDVTDEIIANPDLMLQVQTGFWGTEQGQIKIN